MDHSMHDDHSMGHGDHQSPGGDPSGMHLVTSMPDHDHHGHHDHMAGHGDGSGSTGMHHMMVMWFHGGFNETILFEEWQTSSLSGLIWSMLLIFVMGALYEGLKYYREYLFWKTYNALQYRAVTVPEKNVVSEEGARVVHMVGEVIHKQPPSMLSWMHIYQTLLHIVQVTLSFLLMLIFMTYNVWLCTAVVAGAAVGYFLFGWKKSVVVDVTEHCH